MPIADAMTNRARQREVCDLDPAEITIAQEARVVMEQIEAGPDGGLEQDHEHVERTRRDAPPEERSR